MYLANVGLGDGLATSRLLENGTQGLDFGLLKYSRKTYG